MLIISKFNHLRLNIHHYFNQKLKRIIQPFQFLVIHKLIICSSQKYTQKNYIIAFLLNKHQFFSCLAIEYEFSILLINEFFLLILNKKVNLCQFTFKSMNFQILGSLRKFLT